MPHPREQEDGMVLLFRHARVRPSRIGCSDHEQSISPLDIPAKMRRYQSGMHLRSGEMRKPSGAGL